MPLVRYPLREIRSYVTPSWWHAQTLEVDEAHGRAVVAIRRYFRKIGRKNADLEGIESREEFLRVDWSAPAEVVLARIDEMEAGMREAVQQAIHADRVEEVLLPPAREDVR